MVRTTKCRDLRAVILYVGLVTVLLWAPGMARPACAEAPFVGIVANDKTTTHCRAGAIYVTGKLSQSALVRVEQRILGWYKITPPTGSYSLISKAFVDPRDEGKTGVVTAMPAAIKAPNLKDKGNSYYTQSSLSRDDIVRIRGAYGSYYMIEPPPGAFVYVRVSSIERATKQQIRQALDAGQKLPKAAPPAKAKVKPVADVKVQTEPAKSKVVPQRPPPSDVQERVDSPVAIEPIKGDDEKTVKPVAVADAGSIKQIKAPPQPEPVADITELVEDAMQVEDAAPVEDVAIVEDTVPVEFAEPVDDAPEPAQPAQPMAPDALDSASEPVDLEATVPAAPVEIAITFDQAELRYRQGSKLPADEQPIDELVAMYEQLADRGELDEVQQVLLSRRLMLLKRRALVADTLRKIAEARNFEAQAQPPATDHSAQTAADSPSPAGSPAASLAVAEPARPGLPQSVGWLVTSSVYNGVQLPRLYRLVDPATRRTIVYVDPQSQLDPRAHLGRMVALAGSTDFDAQIKRRILRVHDVEVVSLKTY